MNRFEFEAKLSQITFGVIHTSLDLYERFDIPVISTARPFTFYRNVFYEGASSAEVIEQIQHQTLVDIGCGLTPFTEDSMFQECRRRGISFYGVDPKVGDGFKFGIFDRVKSWGTGARSMPDPNIDGQEKAVAAYANDLPFEDESVDTILSAWLIFSWIRSDTMLADIFRELDRVLKPGGTIRLYPTPEWQAILDSNPALKSVMAFYVAHQQFVVGPNLSSEPPAYSTRLTKPVIATKPIA